MSKRRTHLVRDHVHGPDPRARCKHIKPGNRKPIPRRRADVPMAAAAPAPRPDDTPYLGILVAIIGLMMILAAGGCGPRAARRPPVRLYPGETVYLVRQLPLSAAIGP